MIIVGHDSGDAVTYTLQTDEEGLEATTGNVFVFTLTKKERESKPFI